MSLVYTTIQHGFRKEKGITNNDYVLCDMISQLSKRIDSKVSGWCYMSRENIAEELGLSKRTVISMINSMIDKNLIERHEITGHLRSTLEWESVYFFDGAKIAHPMQNLPNKCAKVAPNNIYNNSSSKEEHICDSDLFKPIEEKPKKTERKKQVFVKPDLKDVKDYFDQKGYSEEGAKKAFDYYEAGDWKDAKGNKVINWKQKMISVWFRPEYKKNESSSSNGKIMFE